MEYLLLIYNIKVIKIYYLSFLNRWSTYMLKITNWWESLTLYSRWKVIPGLIKLKTTLFAYK